MLKPQEKMNFQDYESNKMPTSRYSSKSGKDKKFINIIYQDFYFHNPLYNQNSNP